MNTEDTGALDALVQEKIEADTEFQSSLKEMTDKEKESAISEKATEIRNSEFTSLQEQAKKDAELAENYKKRAEKAEKKEKDGGSGKKTDKTEEREDDLSSTDLYALMNAKVPEEDVEIVQSAAKVLGVSIKEALGNPNVQGQLEQKAEERKTAAAANKGGGKASNKKATDSQLLQNLSDGKIPEKGSDEAEDLFWARRGGRPSGK